MTGGLPREGIPFTAGKEVDQATKPVGPESAGRGEPAFLAEQQRHIDREVLREFLGIGHGPGR